MKKNKFCYWQVYYQKSHHILSTHKDCYSYRPLRIDFKISLKFSASLNTKNNIKNLRTKALPSLTNGVDSLIFHEFMYVLNQ